jgi:thiol-disulfide isomerase/thioredoxin
VQHRRRQFLGSAAMAMAAAHLDGFGVVEAADRVARELAALGRAPQWLNSPRLTAESLRGKVVLVDFWTYTCINWLRTLPYVRAWARTYRENLIVIGVHTPEFPFEHDLDNVRRAVTERNIEYPVVIDNDYAIWRAFRNQYWPALYFVDGRGRIRDHHFGEGEYERSEMTIRRLLSEAGAAGAAKPLVPVEAIRVARTPRSESASGVRSSRPVAAQRMGPGRRMDGRQSRHRGAQSQRPHRRSLSRTRRSSRDGTGPARRPGAVPRFTRRAAARRRSRRRRRRQRPRDDRRAAPLSADPPTRPDRGSHVGDRVPGRGGRGVRVHVRLKPTCIVHAGGWGGRARDRGAVFPTNLNRRLTIR